MKIHSKHIDESIRTGKTLNIAFYIRRSVIKGRGQDDSAQIQIPKLQEYVENLKKEYKLKIEVKYTFIDDGVSGSNLNRDAFRELICCIQQNLIHAVMVTELSRVTRSLEDHLFILKLCKHHNVDCISISEGMTILDEEQDFMQKMRTIINEEDRRKNIKRAKLNIRMRLINDGRINGTSSILGLRKCPKRKGHFIVHDEERERLIRILEIFLTAGNKIETVEMANQKGLNGKNGNDLTIGELNTIIKNVPLRYAGKWYLKEEDEKQEITLDHGRLLKESFEAKVLQKAAILTKRYTRRGKGKFVYILSGLLRSPNGNYYNGQIGHGRSKDYRYYYCNQTKTRIDAESIESEISNKVICYFSKSSELKKLLLNSKNNSSNKIIEVNEELKRIGSKLQELHIKKSNFLNRLSTSEVIPLIVERVIYDSIQSIENEIELISIDKTRLIKLKDTLASDAKIDEAKVSIDKYARGFNHLDRSEKRSILKNIFEKIVVLDKTQVEVHIKKAPREGPFSTSVNNGSTSHVNGGTCRT